VALGNATTDLIAFHGATAVDQGAALTAQLTTITPLYVIKNLQVRLAEVEQRLEEKGLVAAN